VFLALPPNLGVARNWQLLQAKRRVYTIQAASKSGKGAFSKRKRELKEDIAMAKHTNDAVEIVPVLEPLPKWELVVHILTVTTQLFDTH